MEVVVNFLITIISTAGAMIIAYGAFLAIFLFIKYALKIFHKIETLDTDSIRLFFGKYVILGLEFFIAADIIETIFVPTYEEIGLLAGLVILRTILSVFLTKELDQLSISQRNKIK